MLNLRSANEKALLDRFFIRLKAVFKESPFSYLENKIGQKSWSKLKYKNVTVQKGPYAAFLPNY